MNNTVPAGHVESTVLTERVGPLHREARMSDADHVPRGNLPRAERRWTASAFVLVAMAIPFLLPARNAAGTRHLHPAEHPDLAFPQQLEPRLAAPDWRPVFFDYLYLALTNATAFSPTDVMPLARRAKLAMASQSLLSIVILSLVVANAVNLLD
jgi:hypothetical protein